MKIYKKFTLIILTCISLAILLLVINQVYAKYKSSATGNASIPISRWNIVVNATSIRDNPDLSSKIIPTFPGNENIASNIIAPTAEGYFDLSFNFKDVDVSFKYTITVSASENSAVSDLVATGYSIDDGEKIDFTAYNEEITDTIHLTDNVDSRNIRVYVMWDDASDNTLMNNLADTASTSASNSSAIFDVNVSFIQITN